MKKSLFLLPAFALTLALSGCNQDNLDIEQKGVVAFDTYYANDDDCVAALTKMYVDTQKNFTNIEGDYNQIPYESLTNFQADDIDFSGSGPEDAVEAREYHDFRFRTDAWIPTMGYTMIFRSIHKANLVINNFTAERIGTLTPTMKRCVAEARVMRAFDHLLLAIYWNRPPIVTEVLTADSKPASSETQEVVLKFVVDEIDQALADLEERESTADQAGCYKISKGFALGVKGKAQIWLKDYAGAKSTLKQVIQSGKYALVDGTRMKDLLHNTAKGCEESVFEFNIVDDANLYTGIEPNKRGGWNLCNTYAWRSDYFYTIKGRTDDTDGDGVKDARVFNAGWGWTSPDGQFCRDLIANDGMNSYRRKAWIVLWDEFYNEDWANTFADPKEGETRKVGLKPDMSIHNNEGFFNLKTIVHPDQNDCFADYSNPSRNLSIMRYTEILLMYCEACVLSGSLDDGLEILNSIQKRAKSNHISTSLTLDEVVQEKRFELWQEGCRSVDLKRWGKDVDQKYLKPLIDADQYCPNLKTAADPSNPNRVTISIDESEAKLYTSDANIGYHSPKDEFLPFPKNVLDLNPNLVQNPGWENIN